MSQDTQIIQLSKNNIIITFNKSALGAIKKGGAQAIELTQDSGKLTFLFMRDTEFTKRYSQLRKTETIEKPKKPWFKLVWPSFFRSKKQEVKLKETKNRKLKVVE